MVERLGDVVEGAELHRLDRALHRRVARQDQDRDLAGLGDEVGPGRAGEPEVGDDEVEVVELAVGGRLGHRAGLGDVVAVTGEEASQLAANDGLVIDDQDSAHGYMTLARASAERSTVIRVPAPGALFTSTVPPWSATML